MKRFKLSLTAVSLKLMLRLERGVVVRGMGGG